MRITWITLTILTLAFCKQRNEDAVATKQSAPEAVAMHDEAPMESDRSRMVGGNQGQATDNRKMDGPGLGTVALVAPIKAQGRLLEYRVNVSYRSTDLLAGRTLLFDIASRRGFLRNSYASSNSSSMQIEMAVRSSELYDTLKELDRAGELREEQITVSDHTENDFAQELKATREEKRMLRRNLALQGDAAARNWTERDAALARSEDETDAARLEKWRIQDRVNWATIHVSLQGPDLPAPVQVPNYRNAFVGLLNMLLELIYGIIYLSPFLVLGGILFWNRKRILGLFKRGS
ncbi:MAG: DUF4349 domain-containing protein [Leptospirales bacterium]|nr:DUF4349 domain-containing protein [Leptospirales bacterium]